MILKKRKISKFEDFYFGTRRGMKTQAKKEQKKLSRNWIDFIICKSLPF